MNLSWATVVVTFMLLLSTIMEKLLASGLGPENIPIIILCVWLKYIFILFCFSNKKQHACKSRFYHLNCFKDHLKVFLTHILTEESLVCTFKVFGCHFPLSLYFSRCNVN